MGYPRPSPRGFAGQSQVYPLQRIQAKLVRKQTWETSEKNFVTKFNDAHTLLGLSITCPYQMGYPQSSLLQNLFMLPILFSVCTTCTSPVGYPQAS